MVRYVYVTILKEMMLPYAEWNMPLKRIFQKGNDLKHISNLANEWFRVNGVKVMAVPA